MRMLIVAGAPASGKTACIKALFPHLAPEAIAIAKMDCLSSDDAREYADLGYPAITGLSRDVCPDHYLAINFNRLFEFGRAHTADVLIVETAGLCNRCAPFISGALNLCVIDGTAGLKSPHKLGPMVTTANVMVMTKIDQISQAEREILSFQLQKLNPSADRFTLNAITGAGSRRIARHILGHGHLDAIEAQTLRYDMPRAICSYCVGERRIDAAYHQGMVTYMDID